MPTPTSWSDSIAVSLSGSTNIDALLWGTRWANSIITYSFPGFGSDWSTSSITGYGPSDGFREPWSIWFAPLSVSNQNAFVDALQQWANVSNLQFSPVEDTSANVGDIRAAYSYVSILDLAQAWAYFPSDTSYGGDLWINALGSSATEEWTPGSYENFAILHELGHALGLKHPFIGWSVLPASLDSQSFTIMSYAAQPGDFTTHFSFYPTTPMVLDIAAIQYLYGANDSYHAGNDIYAYSDSTRFHHTLWDSGGSDTIQYSGSLNATIDLRSGVEYGSAIGLPIYVVSADGVNLYPVNNIWIAYGVVIENASGGSGDDTLIGNSVDNLLSGGPGDDMLIGNDGNDTMEGGAGVDTMIGGAGDDVYVVDDTSDSAIEKTGEGNDTVVSAVSWALAANLENLVLTGVADLYGLGNAGNNVLIGNAGSNVLGGGGGNDHLLGLEGNDVFVYTEGVDAFDGGDDVDTAVFSLFDAAVVVSLEDNPSGQEVWTTDRADLSSGTWRGIVELSSIENVIGGAHGDLLLGNAGDNELEGGDGNDVLVAGQGHDILDGGNGDDLLIGQLNNDGLTGGAGADLFWFDGSGPGTSDLITDFAPGEDLILLYSNAFAALSPGPLPAENFASGAGISASDPGHFVLYDTGSGDLLYDADGSGAGFPERVAIVGHEPSLSESDIFIV